MNILCIPSLDMSQSGSDMNHRRLLGVFKFLQNISAEPLRLLGVMRGARWDDG